MNTIDADFDKGDPTRLDTFAITNDRGKLMGMFGLGAELYVKPRARAQLRQDMISVQEDYYRLFNTHIDRCFTDDPKTDGKFEPFDESMFSRLRNACIAWPQDNGYTHMLFGSHTHQAFIADANTVTPYLSEFLVEAEIHPELSTYDCYMPVGGPDGKPNFSLLLDALLRWCAILRPAHGNAGFCIVMEPNDTSGEKYAYPLLQRFPGFDIHTPSSFALDVEEIHDRIKTVNWLTVLDDGIVDELGGKATLRAALEPDCLMHAYDGGIVIQAGPLPQLGDTYRDVSALASYRKVAKLTKPVRYAPTGALFKVFPPMIAREEAEKWVARFD
ncbi:type VI immunity family protein [Burkholderia ubonensis]|uniref:type VI immunity family protein n=1 Tax=Burkholderia ubonensis TaxID=101571 RepID=UPI000AED6EA6|nr:type VI immunity family protein [Burkholderia ubonensis]